MAKHYHVSALTGAAKLVGQDIGEKMNPITTPWAQCKFILTMLKPISVRV